MPDTLIIIPVYNEKENIEKLISEIFGYADDVNLLIVDDNSPDRTGVIADRISRGDSRVSVFHRMSRRGRGYAGIDGFKEALKRKGILYIMEMDADFSHDPKYIPQFLKEIRQNDIVIGSRFIEGGRDIERNLVRNSLSRAANFFISRCLGLNVKDCSSGYRCFRRLVIDSLELDSLISRGPAIIEEVLYVSALKGFKIREIPIDFRSRHKGRTKLSFIKLSGVLMDIIRFKDRARDIVRASPSALFGDSRELRGFGFRFALALNALGCIMFYRQRVHFIWFTGIGSLVLIFAVMSPEALLPLKRIMGFIAAMIFRLVNTAFLAVVFYLIVTPIGIMFRLFGKGLSGQRINKGVSSYWVKRRNNIFSTAAYERMG